MNTKLVATSKSSQSSSPLSECQILVWPLSVRTAQNRGLVFGWRTPTTAQPATATRQQGLTFPATAVVAGIIQPEANVGEDISWQHFKDRLVRLQERLCYCCTCKIDGNRRAPCQGCHRRQLFASLQILAWYDNDKVSSSSVTEDQSTTLGRMRHVKMGNAGIPWIDGWKYPPPEHDAAAQYQILYYDDSDTSACYPLESQQGFDSVFTRDVLTCLSNSQAVMEVVRQSQSTESAGHSAVDSILQPLRRDVSEQRPTGAIEDTTPSEMPNVACYSLFVQMIVRLYHRRDMLPLEAIFGALVWKRHDTVLCNTCGKRFIQCSRSQRIHERVDFWNTVLRAMLDWTIGLLLLWLLAETFLGSPDTVLRPLCDYVQLQSRLIQEGTSWLERFPIGFKLNEPLTASLGRELRAIVAFHEVALLRLLELLDILWVRRHCFAVCSIAGVLTGASGLLALLVDMLRLAHVHVWLLSLGFQSVFACELYLLSALWRVFRGKKLNVLRNRTDSMQYDSIQLLVGSVLFAITLFLFTTILVYHVFFAVCNLVVSLGWDVVCGLLLLLREWPAGVLVARCLYGEWHAKSIYLAEDTSPHSSISATTLCPVLERTTSSIFRALTVPLAQVVKLVWFQLHCALLAGKTRSSNLIL